DVDGGSVQGGGHRLFGSFVMRDSIVSNSLDQLFLWFPTEDCAIERTVFLNGGKVTTHMWGADAHVVHNIFWRADSLAPVRDSAIQNREAYLGYATYASGNSFLNPGVVSASLSDWGAAASLDATRNWWSTTDTATVEAMIYDANDSSSVPATIPFEPLLGGPDPVAPHYRLPLSTTAAIGAAPTTIPNGGTANITVTVEDSRTCDVFGTPVVLYASTDGVNWAEVTSGVTGTSGSILFAVSPAVATQYRAEATGVGGVYEASATGIVAISIEGGGVTKVKRISGRDRYAVAVNAARETKDPAQDKSWPGVTHIILASGEDRAAADPLAAAGLSWAYGNAPLILTKSTSVPSAVVQAVGEIAEANQAGQDTVVVHVVGGDMSVPWARLLELADGVRALYGNDAADGLLFDRIQATGSRYDLSRAIALRMKDVRGAEMPARALIANGADSDKFFDALALSAVSARTGAPVLLVGYGTIPSQTTRTLADLGIAATNRYIAGGPNTVSSSVAKTLGVPSANRWYGRTRYSTAKAVADAAVAKGWLDTTYTGVAAKLADALTGGSMTGGVGGALVITTSSPLQSDCKVWLVNRSSSLQQVWVFGGTISVTPSTYNQVVAAVQ
ncbi:MAG: cell wall-binding repeat-containing protein, partial [Coriobacteriia bacterium]|nr:cell wall-binding repeat-containing protein [Coriobacteriia bacterium]